MNYAAKMRSVLTILIVGPSVFFLFPVTAENWKTERFVQGIPESHFGSTIPALQCCHVSNFLKIYHTLCLEEFTTALSSTINLPDFTFLVQLIPKY